MEAKCKNAEKCIVLSRFLTKYTPEEVDSIPSMQCYESANPPCNAYLINPGDRSELDAANKHQLERISRKAF